MKTVEQVTAVSLPSTAMSVEDMMGLGINQVAGPKTARTQRLLKEMEAFIESLPSLSGSPSQYCDLRSSNV